jgi:hypothetical protein
MYCLPGSSLDPSIGLLLLPDALPFAGLTVGYPSKTRSSSKDERSCSLSRKGKASDCGWIMSAHRHLALRLLPACEPFHKFCQPSREMSLNRPIGQPQPLPKLLKVFGVQRLIQRGASWD